MRLEQTIRSTMTEAMDMDGRLDQLVRAGLMPTSSLPLLKRAISRMHAGMSLQGAERDVMNMFISSMMFIVLGDDTVFNKARAGAKGYATEEVELDENAPIVAHLTKRYGDNIRKSHVMSAAKDFGVDPSKLSKAVRKKLGKSMLDEAKDKQEYDYEGDMAISQLKSIIANSQRMHDMLSDDTNLPEWVQSKITLAEDYITTASNYMQGEMTEDMDMPFKDPYRKVGDRKDEYGNKVKNVAKFLAKKAMNKQKNEEVDPDLEAELKATRVTKKSMDDAKKTRERASRMKEDSEQIDELSVKKLDQYRTRARQDIIDADDNDDNRMADKRAGGYLDASRKIRKKLAKEDIDAVKQMNESYKTAFETALNEYGIKSPSELDESKRKEFFNHVDLEFKKGDN